MNKEEKKITVPVEDVILPPRKRFHASGEEGKKGVNIAELLIYLQQITPNEKIKPESVIQRIKDARTFLRDEWNAVNPKTVDEVTQFYINTDGYLYDLYSWTHDDKMWALLDKMFTGRERVLDYGCGIGDVAIYLAEKGCDVTAIELEKGKTLEFAMWRVYQRKLGDKINFSIDYAKDKFDAVLAIDVLEHIYFPLRFVTQFGNLLKSKDSFFFATPSFGDGTDDKLYPMHIKDNDWLIQNYGNAMISLAFSPEYPVDKFYPIWKPGFQMQAEKKVEPQPEGGGGKESSEDSSSKSSST